MEINERIDAIDDDMAIAALRVLGSARQRGTQPELDAHLIKRLAVEAGIEGTKSTHATAGDVARAALHVFAQDPDQSDGLEYLLTKDANDRFLPVADVLLLTGVVVALQSHVRFERDKNGQWSGKFEKRPLSNSTLGRLIKKLLAYIPD